MNNQQVFDKIIRHQREQGEKALDKTTGWCRYKTQDGKKCAAGCLIPNEKYTYNLEGVGGIDGKSHLAWQVLEELGYTNENYNLILDMQTVHDCNEADNWECQWRQLAAKYSLVYTEPSPA